MKCMALKRYRGVQTPVPCGQCMLCRINRRRVWTTRLLLEALPHGNNCCFLTLTYADRSLPYVRPGVSTLYPEHLRLAWYGLRRATSPVRMRYYCVGEYGDITWRPHYHALIFGVAPSMLQGTLLSNRNYQFAWWPHGHVNVGHSVGREAVEYVAQYTTKKLTKANDVRLIPGQVPEFARMSRMGGGGIGYSAIPALVSVAKRFGFVPRTIRIGGKEHPLGRYLQGRVSLLSGCPTTSLVEQAVWREEMLDVWSDSVRLGILETELLSRQGLKAARVISARPVKSSRSL